LHSRITIDRFSIVFFFSSDGEKVFFSPFGAESRRSKRRPPSDLAIIAAHRTATLEKSMRRVRVRRVLRPLRWPQSAYGNIFRCALDCPAEIYLFYLFIFRNKRPPPLLLDESAFATGPVSVRRNTVYLYSAQKRG